MMRATNLSLFIAFFAVALGAQDRLAEGIRQFEQGDYVAAEKTLQGLSRPDAQAFLALTHAATSRCDAAEPALAVAFKDEQDPRIRKLTGLALARCAIASERFEQALAPLNQLERDLPDDADVLYESARLHLKAWNAAVERMFDRTPDSFRVHQLSGEIFEIQGDFAAAAGEYRKAIAQSPATLNLNYRLGRVLLMGSREPETLARALRAFEAELMLNPRDAVAEYQVAQLLQVQGRLEPAAKRFARAAELDPEFAEARIALAKLRLAQDRNDEAIDLLEAAAKLAPASEAAHYNLMLAYRNADRRDDARAAQQRLQDLQKAPEGEFSEFLERIGASPEQ